MATGKSVVVEEVYVGLKTLRPGARASVRVMVCRSWDVTNMSGKYRSTEYILSDDQENAIQCSARSNIAHCFASKLEVGNVYSLKDFTVIPNKDKYRVRHTDSCIIQLEGYTIVKKVDCSLEAYDRFPFQLTSIDDIKLNDSTFLIDVMGFSIEVGDVKTTPTGSELLDLRIINEKGTRIRVTLWGALCNDFFNRTGHQSPGYIVIFPSMNVKDYQGEIFMSSTSATTIFDSLDIPQIAAYHKLMKECSTPAKYALPPEPVARRVSVVELKRLGKEQKETRRQTTTLECKVRISDIRAKDSWFYNACGIGGCKKRVGRLGTGFWCETCKKGCDFPQTSYRIHVVAEDVTGSVVLTLFDAAAEVLVKKKAATLLENSEADGSISIIPQELRDLVGTCHIFQMKTHTYYDKFSEATLTVNKVVVDNIHDPELRDHGKRVSGYCDTITDEPANKRKCVESEGASNGNPDNATTATIPVDPSSSEETT